MTGAVEEARRAVDGLSWDDPVSLRRAARALLDASLELDRQRAAERAAQRAEEARRAAEMPPVPLPPLLAGQTPASWFKDARAALGISRRELATASGLSVGSVASLETAARPVRRRVVVMIVEGLAGVAGCELPSGLVDELVVRLDAAALLASPGQYEGQWIESRRKQRRPDLVRRQLAARRSAAERLGAAQAEAGVVL